MQNINHHNRDVVCLQVLVLAPRPRKYFFEEWIALRVGGRLHAMAINFAWRCARLMAVHGLRQSSV